MNDERSLDAAMWVMVIVQIIGNVDLPGQGSRKLPAPRAFVPVVVGFGLLHVMADAGMSRAAKTMGWLTVLTAAVLGPFGTTLVNLLNSVATTFGSPTKPQVLPNPDQQGVTS